MTTRQGEQEIADEGQFGEIDVRCDRCKCCEMEWTTCDNCGGEGTEGHDCGEDCCCCLNPEDNLECELCDGEGGWYRCIGRCDKNGHHKSESIIHQHNE